jgi:spore germination protein KB
MEEKETWFDKEVTSSKPMDKVRIDSMQLFCLMYLFELGSSIVVGIGISAKQDAWLAILIAMIIDIPLYLIYYYLFIQYPNLPLTRYLTNILGKYVGFPLSIVYILYFLYIAARVLRDLGDLLVSSTLDLTPLTVVTGFMMLIISYGVYNGIEVIGRTSEMALMMLILIGVLGLLFTLGSDIIKPEKLLPVLENGWKPVLKTVFPQLITFPFGEMIVFTMVLPSLNKPLLGKKVGVYAMLASGLTLSMVIALEISILGPEGVAQSQFPLLDTFSKVSIGEFIERLDVFVVLTLIFGVFVKISVFFYAAFTGVAELLRITNQKQRAFCIILLGILVVIWSIQMSENFVEHIETGLKKVPIYLHVPLQIVIPILLFLIVLVRKSFVKVKPSESDMDS